MIDINNNHKVNASFNIDPELYIYLQKKANDELINIEEVLNKIIREHALKSLTTIQYVPYKEPDSYTYPIYPTITCNGTTNVTTTSNNQTDLFKYFDKDE